MKKNKMTGFFMTVGNKGIFLESSLEKKSKSVVEGMIDAIGKLKVVNADVIAQCKADRQSYEKIQYAMSKATLEYITTQGGYQYMSIHGDNFTENFPPENYGDVIIIKEGELNKVEPQEKAKSVGLQIGLGSTGYYAHNPRTRSTKEQLNYYQLIQLIAEYMIKHPDRTVEPIHKDDITNERLNNMIIVAKNGMLGNTFESQKNLSRGNNIVVNYGSDGYVIIFGKNAKLVQDRNTCMGALIRLKKQNPNKAIIPAIEMSGLINVGTVFPPESMEKQMDLVKMVQDVLRQCK